MKRAFFFTIVLATFISCSQDELQFSCDPAINEYITSHREELSILTADDLSDYDLGFQQAVFRSYTVQKKREIWLQKIQYLLDHEVYTPVEAAQISKLKDHLSENYFDGLLSKSDSLNRSSFSKNWIKEAKEILKWSDKQIAFVIYRLYTRQNQFDAELLETSSFSTQGSGDPENNCTCNINENFCGTNCISGSCKLTESGCGWLWSAKCDGRCF